MCVRAHVCVCVHMCVCACVCDAWSLVPDEDLCVCSIRVHVLQDIIYSTVVLYIGIMEVSDYLP